MSGTTIFEKGQIWYWEDPIYGAKTERRLIHKNVRLQCYSRYVLIIQNTGTININEPVMCVPLTSSVTNDEASSDKYVKLTIYNGVRNAAISYAALDRLFPADAKALKTYQCKIGDRDMSIIENKIKMLILSESKDDADYPPQITIEDIKCIDIKESDDNLDNPECSKPKHRKTKTTWTPENKAKYLQEYETKECEYLMKKYNLSKRSVQNYAYVFKKAMGDNTVSATASADKKVVEDDSNNNQETNTSTKMQIPSTYNIQRSISKFCNKIKSLIKIKDMYNKVSTYFNSGETIEESAFYTDMSAAIYFGIAKFLNINVIDGKMQPVVLSAESKHLTTFQFFDIYWNDYMVARMINLDSITKLCKEKYSCYIEKEVLNDIKAQISKKIKMSDKGYDMITSYIEKFMG